jgi:hypothetical protein
MKTNKKIKNDLNYAQFEYVMKCAVDKCMTDLGLESSGFEDDLKLLVNDKELLYGFANSTILLMHELIFDQESAKVARDNFNKDLN